MGSMIVVAMSMNGVLMTIRIQDNIARARLGVLTVVAVGTSAQTTALCPTATSAALTTAATALGCV